MSSPDDCQSKQQLFFFILIITPNKYGQFNNLIIAEQQAHFPLVPMGREVQFKWALTFAISQPPQAIFAVHCLRKTAASVSPKKQHHYHFSPQMTSATSTDAHTREQKLICTLLYCRETMRTRKFSKRMKKMTAAVLQFCSGNLPRPKQFRL